MNKEEAVNQVLRSIAKDCKMEVSNLHLLGITKPQIEKAIQDCLDKKLSVKRSVKIVLNIWKSNNPNNNASESEMELLGFKKQPLMEEFVWHHAKADILITEEQRNELSFFAIEQMAIHALADKQKKQ